MTKKIEQYKTHDMKLYLLNSVLILYSFCTYAQKEKTLTFGGFDVYKYPDGIYKILDQKEKVALDSLRFVYYAGNSLQILDKKTELYYLNEKLDKIPYPEPVQDSYCGTVADFRVQIINQKDYYILEKTEDRRVYNTGINTYILDSISKSGISKICFTNGHNQIDYDENFYFPETVIIYSSDSIGIHDDQKTNWFADVDYSNPYFIKVKQEVFWGYYNLTEVKYKNLGDFEFSLASFETVDGRFGFVSNTGIEYVKQP